MDGVNFKEIDRRAQFANDATDFQKKIKEEVAEHKKQEEENNYFLTLKRMVEDGDYSAGKLKSFGSLAASKCSTGSTVNSQIYESSLRIIQTIQETAEKQIKKLEGFDIGTRYSDIKTGMDNTVTREDYDFAEKVYNRLRQDGDNETSFHEVLKEVQGGYKI